MIDIRKRIQQRNFVEAVGRRLFRLAGLDKQPKEVRDHYQKIATQRCQQWLRDGGGLQPEVAETVAFSVHTEAENSWAEMKKEMDNPVILSQELDTEYLDEKMEEADYIGWLKKKGYLDDNA